jgi:Tfp pilus assembly protein PilE
MTDIRNPPPLPNQSEINKREIERRKNRAYEKFCPSCDELIKIKSLHCTNCGAKQKKEELGCLPVGAIAIGITVMIAGILSSIAIPHFENYRIRKYEENVKSELTNLYTAEKVYYQANKKFTDNLTELNFKTSRSYLTVEIISADENCFEAKGEAVQQKKTFWVDCTGEVSMK